MMSITLTIHVHLCIANIYTYSGYISTSLTCSPSCFITTHCTHINFDGYKATGLCKISNKLAFKNLF